MIVKADSTDVTTYFVLRKAADATELTGATITDIDLVYTRSGVDHVAKVDATALANPGSAHSDNKAIEVDATSAPGLYRVDWPDAAFATGVREVILTVIYATAFTEHLRVELSPAVDVVAISGDTTAADNLEAAFDTTGTVLTLSQLRINSAAAGGGVDIDNSNGPAIDARGSTMGIYVQGAGASNYAIEAVGTGVTDSGGIKASATTAGEGFEGRGAGNGHGMLVVGAGSGEGLHATAGAAANGHGAHFEGVGANSSGLVLSRGGAGGDDLNFANNDVTIANVTTVNGLAAGVITATAIADGAIDNATFAADVGTTAYATNNIALAADKAIVQQRLDHLVAVADADDAVNDSIVAKLASKSATADWSTYVNTTDSLEANRDNIGTAGANLTVTTGTISANAITAAAIATDAIDADAIKTDALTEIANAMAIESGTCQAGSSYNNIILAADESAVNDYYNGCLVSIVSGTGAGQARFIADYTGATTTAIVDNPWTTAPTNTSVYRIYPYSGYLLADTGMAQAWAASTITLATTAPAIADSYIGHTIFISGGTGIGQARLITAYTNTRICTVSPAWTTVPDATSVYMVIPVGRVYVNTVATDAISATAIAADAIDASALATDAVTEIVDAIYAKAVDTGVTFAEATKIILAAAAGDITLAAGTYTVKDQDGASVYSFTVNATDRAATIT